MITEVLRKEGYRTAAFISGAPLSSRFGLNRGFEYYDDEFQGPERKADQTTLRAVDWIRNQQEPYFVWVHYFDPHAEYDPPESFRSKFPSAPYDGEIAFVDHQLQSLIQQAGSNTFIIVTADHGEGLGEHEEKTHGVFLYNTTLRVPLIITGPNISAGVRSDFVSLIDVAPTVLEKAGVISKFEYEGTSLMKPINNRMLLAESLYASRNFGYASLFAAISENKKYIHAPQPEFFELDRDPQEKQNLWKQQGIDAWRKAALRYSQSATRVASETPDDEELEKMRSLGYVSGNLSESSIDPKTRVKSIDLFNEGMRQIWLKEYAAAEQIFQRLTETEKANALAFQFLGDAQAAQLKYANAAAAYSASWKLLPDPEAAVRFAKALQRTGDSDRAEFILKDAIKKFPESSETIFELASLYGSQQRWKEAEDLLQKDHPDYRNQKGILFLLKKDPSSAKNEFAAALKQGSRATYWNNLGIALQRLGQPQEAERSYREALKRNPDDEEFGANLAFLLIEQKRWDEAIPPLEKITNSNPHLYRARFALGFAFEHMGRTSDAQRTYRKLLQDAPSNWPERSKVELRVKNL